jgi:hypothetical protein
MDDDMRMGGGGGLNGGGVTIDTGSDLSTKHHRRCVQKAENKRDRDECGE